MLLVFAPAANYRTTSVLLAACHEVRITDLVTPTYFLSATSYGQTHTE